MDPGVVLPVGGVPRLQAELRQIVVGKESGRCRKSSGKKHAIEFHTGWLAGINERRVKSLNAE